MKKDKLIKAVIGFFGLSLILTSCGNKENNNREEKKENTTIEKQIDKEKANISDIKIQDDLYHSINNEWINNAVLSETKPNVSNFTEIEAKVDKVLNDDFNNALDGNKKIKTESMDLFLEFYKMVKDDKKRDADGVTPLISYIKKIENINSMEDLEKTISEFIKYDIPTPFYIKIQPDENNAQEKTLLINNFLHLLSNKGDYSGEGILEAKDVMNSNFQKSFKDMLIFTGKNDEDAKAIVDRAMAFEALLVNSEPSDASEEIIKEDLNTFASHSKNIKLDNLILSLLPKEPKYISVKNLHFFKNIDNIINEENLENIKSWLMVNLLEKSTTMLSEEFEMLSYQPQINVSGKETVPSKEKRAYDLANEKFNDVIGIYYGKTYLGEDSKKDVQEMTEQFIDIYKERLKANDWLSEDTKASAIKKLDNIFIQMAYPENAPEYYSKISINKDKSLFENILNLNKIKMEYQFENFFNPIDRNDWIIPAHKVNAFYNPSSNTIIFPAGILQEPFYSKNVSPSTNYGGIGTVIAHEISHAFDAKGMNYDEFGNVSNWWTEKDYNEFEKKSNAVKEQFSKLKLGELQVDGETTLNENIADAGGLSVALEATKGLPNPNLEEFFISWATVWRNKSTPDWDEAMILSDEHAPAQFRTNIQAGNLDDFYNIFKVKEGDGMYIPKEERTKVW